MAPAGLSYACGSARDLGRLQLALDT